MTRRLYDVIVIGAGHAGCEAALASARMGCQTLLVTMNLDKIGLMSCNPAVGGIGKGQLVKELDALGGEMGRATDTCAIQFRTLNASKGAAVWSSRAQVDRKKYSLYMQKTVKKQKGLKVCEGEVNSLIVKDGVIVGVETAKKEKIPAKTVIVAPGTFLNGLIHIGMRAFAGGRIEEKRASKALSDNLRKLGFRMLRFKTGTCARLDGKTIDFSRMQAQKGDASPRPFSLSTKRPNLKQVPCYITYTDEKTHQIIRKNLNHSPLYSGKITGTGVRYCPSFEDKVVKFPHHSRHQIFLEPEGRNTDEYYPNGLSTSLPEDVQEQFIRSVPGLEKVKINRFGYGIEHDVVDSTQLFPTLETKLIKNLYLAGQINGTTGYEEAAAQGLMAGISAALRVRSKEPFILDRSTSYIGVLIDDLITKGTPEPYRMFTSRVEYRLILREDNADLRLRRFGYELGLVSKCEFEQTQQKQKQIQAGLKHLKETRTVFPWPKTSTVFQPNRESDLNSIGKLSPAKKKISLYQLLKRPGIKIKDLGKLPFKASPAVLLGVETEVKYSGFIQRQFTEVHSFKHLEKIKIPPDLNYNAVNGLSREIKEKLAKFRPLTLGQANRISGITPTAIMILQVYLKKRGTLSRCRMKKLQRRFSSAPRRASPRNSTFGVGPEGHFPEQVGKRYYRFSGYLKERFGCRVYKVSIDAGFSCPNRDGTKSKDGCIYCDNRGFSYNTRLPMCNRAVGQGRIATRPVETQIKEGIDFGRRRLNAEKFMVYFQAYTNTYAPVKELKKKYDVIKKFKDVVGIAIGTRPDCVNDKVLDLVESYSKDYEVWLEYGLQSIHEKSLKAINRGHSYEDFLQAVRQTRRRKGIKICAHVILGLPGETIEDILATAKELGRLKIDGVKIHPLHIIKGTKLERLFKKGVYKPPTQEQYVSLATEFLEHLWPKTVIQRISADCLRQFLVAPEWILDKNKVLKEIEDVLLKRDACQGKLYKH